MAQARDGKWGGLNVSLEEQALLTEALARLDIDDAATLVRKCVAIGLPALLHNPLLARVVDLKDVAKSMGK